MRSSRFAVAAVSLLVVLTATSLCVPFSEAASEQDRVHVFIPPESLDPGDPMEFILGYESISAGMCGLDNAFVVVDGIDYGHDELFTFVTMVMGEEFFVTSMELATIIDDMGAGAEVYEEPGTSRDTGFLRHVAATAEEYGLRGLAEEIRREIDLQTSFADRLRAASWYGSSKEVDLSSLRHGDDDNEQDDEQSIAVVDDDGSDEGCPHIPEVNITATPSDGFPPSSQPVVGRGPVL